MSNAYIKCQCGETELLDGLSKEVEGVQHRAHSPCFYTVSTTMSTESKTPTPTPRTDEAQSKWDNQPYLSTDDVVKAYRLARQLETELSEAIRRESVVHKLANEQAASTGKWNGIAAGLEDEVKQLRKVCDDFMSLAKHYGFDVNSSLTVEAYNQLPHVIKAKEQPESLYDSLRFDDFNNQ